MDYVTAIAVGRLIALLGWVAFIGGWLALFGAFSAAPVLGVFSLGVTGGLIFSGLLMIAAGQIVRATADNANNTRQILEHLRKQQTLPHNDPKPAADRREPRLPPDVCLIDEDEDPRSRIRRARAGA